MVEVSSTGYTSPFLSLVIVQVGLLQILERPEMILNKIHNILLYSTSYQYKVMLVRLQDKCHRSIGSNLGPNTLFCLCMQLSV